MSLAEQFAAVECRREPVYIPAIGKTVYVRERTVAEKDEFDHETLDLREQGIDVEKTLRARLIVWMTEDEQGKPVFTGDDAEMIQQKPWRLFEPILAKYNELNGNEATAAETAEKNGETGGGDSSAGSASPPADSTSTTSPTS